MLRKEYDHIILLAHGSPDPTWKKPFESLYDRAISRFGAERSSLAYMELTEPSLEYVVQHLDKRVKKVAVLPLFFAVGRHLRYDVPAQIESLKRDDLEIDLLSPIGEDDIVKQAMDQVIAHHLGNHD